MMLMLSPGANIRQVWGMIQDITRIISPNNVFTGFPRLPNE